MNSSNHDKHSFHIPVLGIGFSVDTPLKVAHLGIDSVISLSDDQLLEQLRKKYSTLHQLPYKEIPSHSLDHRAARITAYLNLINQLVKEKVKDHMGSDLSEEGSHSAYYNGLPLHSSLRREFHAMRSGSSDVRKQQAWAQEHHATGSIDVNIMTKVDKQNTFEKKALPVQYNDAHAALRGFAESDLRSSLILSAGMNPSLYNYIAQFDDFFPARDGVIKKKIILKVSDFRSALIQGKYLAKRGVWVSEYRIESGLNCGGHAFATEGLLMGPILEEFNAQREALKTATFELLCSALNEMNKLVPAKLDMRISVQGGVGTSEEHEFLIDHFGVDSVGWGSPFLLVPEATNVDDETLKRLCEAKEDDLYLSGVSPLGVPYNNLRGNSKDAERDALTARGRPGSACPKKYLALNKEYGEKALCTASRQYQQRKIQELDDLQLPEEAYGKAFDRIVEKSCICVGLGTSALLTNGLDTRREKEGVSVCPGPNMAYFSSIVSLRAMVDHIYGRRDILQRNDRPHMFVKEFNLYVDHLKAQIDEAQRNFSRKKMKYLQGFAENLERGAEFYKDLLTRRRMDLATGRAAMEEALNDLSTAVSEMQLQIRGIGMAAVVA